MMFEIGSLTRHVMSSFHTHQTSTRWMKLHRPPYSGTSKPYRVPLSNSVLFENKTKIKRGVEVV